MKRPWTPEEDELLIAAVAKYGACRWSMIATQLSTGRVGKQCRERWNNHLCPEVKKTEWSEEEDRAIMQGVAVLGTRWCEIVKAPALSGRTDNAIKNRFYSLQRRMKARLTGGHRAGRRAQGPAGSDDEAPPMCQTDRIMAIATELAFATDECERDRLIENLTSTLHENLPEAGMEDDSSDIGPLESPDALSGLHAMSKDLFRGSGVSRPAAARSNAATMASFKSALGDPLPGSLSPISVPLPHDFGSAASLASALEPSVAAVADLLPLLGGESATETVKAAFDIIDAAMTTKLPAPRSPGVESTKEADDMSTASTISPDGAGGASSIDTSEAWRVPVPTASAVTSSVSSPAADDKVIQPIDSNGHEEPLQDKTLADRNTPEPLASSMCSGVTTHRGTVRARPTAITEAEVNANGSTIELKEASISASLLGGRHAYKAMLAPLRLPAEQLSEVDSPKRLRTPTGFTPGGGSAKSRASALRVCAIVANGATDASPATGGAPPLPHAATGTDEPSAVRVGGMVSMDGVFSPTSPMSELLNLSIFTDLFAEESATHPTAVVAPPSAVPVAAADAVAACLKGLSHTDSIDSNASAATTVATAAGDDAMDITDGGDDEATASRLVSPDTANTTATPTCAVKATVVGAAFGKAAAHEMPTARATTRRSARAC